MLKINKKRELEILKSNDEFQMRLRKLTWINPTSDTKFRLACLSVFTPELSERQIFNLARINQGGF